MFSVSTKLVWIFWDTASDRIFLLALAMYEFNSFFLVDYDFLSENTKSLISMMAYTMPFGEH